jgi:mannose-6-phosphate isomerase-like protein (cupin superfamily)
VTPVFKLPDAQSSRMRSDQLPNPPNVGSINDLIILISEPSSLDDTITHMIGDNGEVSVRYTRPGSYQVCEGHPSDQLIAVVRGELEITMADGKRRLHAGLITLIPAGSRYCFAVSGFACLYVIAIRNHGPETQVAEAA